MGKLTPISGTAKPSAAMRALCSPLRESDDDVQRLERALIEAFEKAPKLAGEIDLHEVAVYAVKGLKGSPR